MPISGIDYLGFKDKSQISYSIRDEICSAALDALTRGPYSVMDKTTLPPSKDKSDYYHVAPYHWPRRFMGKWLPPLRRDGERLPGTRLYEPLSDQYDRTRLQRMFDDTAALVLAWCLTDEDRFALHAIQLIETWFVDARTRMNPHLKYAQVRLGRGSKQGSKSGVIEFKDVYFFLDAVRILREHSGWTATIETKFVAWMAEYSDWLQTSPQGAAEAKSSNNHGTCYDLQLGSIAAFLGDQKVLESIFEGLKQRLLEQFTADGFQPLEASRTQTQHYFAFNLQCWLNLAALTGACELDLWELSSEVDRPLMRALSYFLSFIGQSWPMKQIEDFSEDRYGPLILEYNMRQAVSDKRIAMPQKLNSVLFPHYGVRPFWLLRNDILSFLKESGWQAQ